MKTDDELRARAVEVLEKSGRFVGANHGIVDAMLAFAKEVSAESACSIRQAEGDSCLRIALEYEQMSNADFKSKYGTVDVSEAMLDFAEKVSAANAQSIRQAAMAEAAAILDMKPSAIRLTMGELSAQEMRAVLAYQDYLINTIERAASLPAGVAVVPVGALEELKKIALVVCRLDQNIRAPDSQPVMQWDDAQLTLGTLRAMIGSAK